MGTKPDLTDNDGLAIWIDENSEGNLQLSVSHKDHGHLGNITDFNNELESDQTWFTYIIKCEKIRGKNKGKIKYYVGQTWNLKKRFRQHAKGEGSNWMKKNGYKPKRYVYYEKHVSCSNSLEREETLKNKSHNWKKRREKEFEKENGKTLDQLMKSIKRF